MDPPRELGERGLTEAMARLRARVGGEWYQVPFTEAVLWITSLKELHGNAIDYTTNDGRTLKALGWARNYAAHELLTLSTVDLASSGFSGVGVTGVSMLGTAGRIVWVDESALTVRADERGRRAIYQALEAGRGILEPLERAETYLMSLP